MEFRTILSIISIGIILLLAINSGFTNCLYVDVESSSDNSFEAWVSTLWDQTTESDFNSGVLGDVDTSSSPGDVKLNEGDYAYAVRGADSAAFWKYDIASNSWESMQNTPIDVNDGGALVYDGSNYIYGVEGGGRKGFWRYKIATNSWTILTQTQTPHIRRRSTGI